jgi:redox-sensitive bicupin YhaK (pirin superfamily)
MIELVLESHRRDLGGFEVGRALPQPARRMIGPFVFFDHMGPVQFKPGFPKSVDVRPHPHIGLSTVTYLLEGEITHRDSVGSEVAIIPGEVNWMTAGRGVTHSERFETLRRRGGTMHGLQAWVALPEGMEEIEPSFGHHGAEDLPTFDAPDGLWGRLIVGKAFGAEAKVKTYSPMFYAHWRLKAGARAQLGADYPERAAFVAEGQVEVDGRTFETGQMLVFAAGEPVLFTGVGESSHIMLLGGEPVGPRFIEWNFVSSSRERIEQAKADWRARRMKLPDADHAEFIPLPG